MAKPQSAPATAVIYCRISDDKSDGKAVAVERQEAICRDFAHEKGITVTRVYVDNSISATKGKMRPDFEQMLKDRPPAIIAWHQDRLIRLTKELERVIELDVPIYTVAGGIVDLSTPQGRAVARTVAAWSTYEGEQKSDRQDVATTSFISMGEPVPGKRRFGYLAADKELGRRVNIKMHPLEGPQVQALFEEFLGGASVSALAKKMNWRNLRVRETLSNPAYAGWIVRRGERYPAAEHVDRLVSQEDFDAVQARLKDRSETYRANSPGGVVKHLASGIARCGVCDTPMVYRNAYLCLKDLSHPTIKEEFVDRKIQEAVVEALIDPDFSVEGDPGAQSIRVAQQEIASLEEGIQDLLSGLNSNLKMAQLLPHLKPLQEAQAAAQSRIEALLHESVQARLMAEIAASIKRHLGSYPSGQWPTPMPQGTIVRWEYRKLSLDQKRELVRGLLDVKVNPGRGPGRVIVTRRRH
jgi:DNA invertase Pin-like site-specific DNA recombinase